MKKTVCAALFCSIGIGGITPAANAQTRAAQFGETPAADLSRLPVTDEGYDAKSAGCTFYLDVPMIDNDLGGVGDAITAEGIINSVRFAGLHPEINHIVFRMKTGGGKMFHAEAMLDVIEEYHDKLEYHIVIEDAISAGIWTAFSCDNIFMTERGSIGGAVIYMQLPDGSVMESPEIPFVADLMARHAEKNGHPGALLPAMIHMPAELHYWKEDGEHVLSNNPPRDKSTVQDYEQLDRSDEVLTLTTDQAVRIGLAQRIGGLDAQLVGEKIAAPQWTRANQYGKIVDEIGSVYNITMPMQDMFFQRKLELPYIRRTSKNRNDPEVIEIIEERQSLERMVDALKLINTALNELPYCHPERHIYFEGEDGKTILADPAAWHKDTQKARDLAKQISSGQRGLGVALRMMEVDQKNVEDIEKILESVKARIDEIAKHGNAEYWANHAED